jgi:hypothetical protein
MNGDSIRFLISGLTLSFFSNDLTMRYFQDPPELKLHSLPLEQTR